LRFSPGRPPVEEYFGTYTNEQRINASNTGYDLAGKLYRPHITITRFNDTPDENALPKLDLNLSFTAEAIGLFEADDMGATKQLIEEFSLVRS
jgi:hypothetical protein